MYLAREYRRMTDVIFSVAVRFVSVCQITSIIRFSLVLPTFIALHRYLTGSWRHWKQQRSDRLIWAVKVPTIPSRVHFLP
jgi:hypothetical protein